MGKRHKTRHVLYVLASIAAVLASSAAIFLSFHTIDLSPHRERVEAILKATTGKDVAMDSVHLKVLPLPSILVKGLTVFHNADPLVKVESASLRLSPLMLLFRKAVIHDIDIRGAGIFVKRDALGRVNLVEFLKNSAIRPELRSVRIVRGGINFIDDGVSPKRSYDARDIDVSASMGRVALSYSIRGSVQGHASFSLKGKASKDLHEISGDMELKGADMEDMLPYLKGADIHELRGKAEGRLSFTLKDGIFTAWDGDLAYNDLFFRYKEAQFGSSTGSLGLSLIYSRQGFDINIERLGVSTHDFTLNGRLRLAGNGKEARFSSRLSTTPIDIAKAFGVIGSSPAIRKSMPLLKDITPKAGAIAIESLEAEGLLKDLEAGRLSSTLKSLDLRLSGIGFRTRGLKREFAGIGGLIGLSAKTLYLKDMKGSYSGISVEGLNGEVRDIAKDPVSDLSLKAFFDAKEAIVLSDEPFMAKLPLLKRLSALKPSGKASLTLSLKGRLKHAERADYSGRVWLKNASLTIPETDLTISQIDMDAGFDRKVLEVDSLSAGFKGADARLKGVVRDYLGDRPFLEMSADASITGDAVNELKHRHPALNGLDVNGGIEAKLTLKGRIDAFAADAFVDASRSSIAYRGLVRKAVGAPLSIKARGALSGTSIDAGAVELTLGSSIVSMEGRYQRDSGAYDLSARSKGLSLQDLSGISHALSNEFKADGSIAFDVSAKRTDKDSPASYKGEAMLTNGTIKLNYIKKPLEVNGASLVLAENTADLAIKGIKAGRTEARLSMASPDIKGRVVSFNLSSPEFYTQDLFDAWPKGNGNGISGIASISGLNASGRVSFNKGSLFGHGFKDLGMGIRVSDGRVFISPISIAIDKGSVSGTITINTRPRDGKTFEAGFNASGIDLETMLSASGAKGKTIAGGLSGSIDLWGRANAGNFLEGINGTARLHVEKGRLWEFVLFSKLFSIVNIVSIDELFKEGLPFRYLTGDFVVKDGIISTEDMYLDSDSLRMSAAGSIDMPKASIDGYLALHPFVTIDKIISKIPLAGWIITGRKETTLSMYFSVKGPLKDPSTEPAPIVTIGKNILDLLERLVETPLELIIPH